MEASACANRLRQLSRDVRFKQRSADLAEIADEVESDDADSWASVDLLAAFPIDTTVTVRTHRSVEAILGAAASIVVFLPVAWTWWSFHAAAQTYHDYLQSASGRTPPFLVLWVQGFGGRLAAWHRLTPVTFISAVLILIAVFLVALHRMVVSGQEARETKEINQASGELTQVLVQAQRMLARRRTADPTAIEAMIKRSVKELRTVHNHSAEAARELHEATRTIRGDLQQLLTSLVAAAGALEQTVQSSNQASSGLVDAAVSLAQASKKSTQDVSQALVDGAGIAKAAVQELAQSVGQSTGAHHDLAGEVAVLSAAEQRAMGDMRELATQLQAAVERLDNGLMSHSNAMQAQINELTGARDGAERMLRLLEGNLTAPAIGQD